MNHPFFYLSIATLGLFYGVFVLSLVRDFFRHRDTGNSGGNLNKSISHGKHRTPDIKSVIEAHWITGGPAPIISKPIILNPFDWSKWTPSLSDN